MNIPETTDIYIDGPVDGMGEASPNGDYFKVSIIPTHARTHTYKISIEQVKELHEALDLIVRKTA